MYRSALTFVMDCYNLNFSLNSNGPNSQYVNVQFVLCLLMAIQYQIDEMTIKVAIGRVQLKLLKYCSHVLSAGLPLRNNTNTLHNNIFFQASSIH